MKYKGVHIMTKKIFALSLVVIVTISVTACGGGDQPATPVQESQPAQETQPTQETQPVQESQPATTQQDVFVEPIEFAEPTETTQERDIEGYFWRYTGGDLNTDQKFMRFEDGLVYMYNEDVELIDTFNYTLSSTRLSISDESFGVEFDSYEDVDYLRIIFSNGNRIIYEKLQPTQESQTIQQSDLLGTWVYTDGSIGLNYGEGMEFTFYSDGSLIQRWIWDENDYSDSSHPWAIVNGQLQISYDWANIIYEVSISGDRLTLTEKDDGYVYTDNYIRKSDTTALPEPAQNSGDFEGRLEVDGGIVLEGIFENNALVYGTMTWPNGNCWKGYFHNGDLYQGEKSFPSEEFHEYGNFENGVLVYGVQSGEGYRWEGEFVNGELYNGFYSEPWGDTYLYIEGKSVEQILGELIIETIDEIATDFLNGLIYEGLEELENLLNEWLNEW